MSPFTRARVLSYPDKATFTPDEVRALETALEIAFGSGTADPYQLELEGYARSAMAKVKALKKEK